VRPLTEDRPLPRLAPATRARRAAPALLVAAALGILLGPAAAGANETPTVAHRHMVVAAHPHAAEAGRQILRAGGSAVDAAIAVQLVLSMVEPQSSGVGGGAFMLHYAAPANRRARPVITAYDGRETAPAAATADMFLDDNGRPAGFFAVGTGGLAVGVPGAMRMLEQAHRDHGRLPWAALFAPAIALAERGFEVSPRLHTLLDRFGALVRVPEFRAHYYGEDGAAHPVGHRLVNHEYAATLRLLASGGADAMYRGALAEAIVAAVRHNEAGAGRMTLEDLAAYRARRTEPLCSPYREWRVCGPRPPSSGGVTVHQILGLLERVEAPSYAADPVRALHLLAEASRLAFADRNLYLADPDFVDVPVQGLLSPAYLGARAALIDAARAMPSVAPGRPAELAAWHYAPGVEQDVLSTSHFSIVDGDGNAVSMTTTVQSAFGSQVMVGGFILNNQLTDFSFEPEVGGVPVANRPEAGKRPLSSMSPTLVIDADDRLRFVIGSPGGTRIIGFVAQTLVGVLAWGQNVQEAIAAPRVIAQLGPIELEEDTPVHEHADALRALGHRVAERNLNSGLHGIVIEGSGAQRRLLGGADPRREGVALGD
jgi:gamma-glutamyltranspeptidase / glutathione hydrolase